MHRSSTGSLASVSCWKPEIHSSAYRLWRCVMVNARRSHLDSATWLSAPRPAASSGTGAVCGSCWQPLWAATAPRCGSPQQVSHPASALGGSGHRSAHRHRRRAATHVDADLTARRGWLGELHGQERLRHSRNLAHCPGYGRLCLTYPTTQQAGQSGVVDRSLCDFSGQPGHAPSKDRFREPPTFTRRARVSRTSLVLTSSFQPRWPISLARANVP